MQIKKTYREVNPELLYNEVKDFTVKQGAVIVDAKLETYSLPDDSSSFVTRGTLTFKMPDASASSGAGKTDKECISAHIVGSARGETKLLLDIDEKLFPQQKVSALQADLDFILGSYEVKPGQEPARNQ
ncbi:MAG: hypothetical protein HYX80_04035 [Chloroflexi bacterium]|nr:hypothetical protein [Chloroflexota bacterium]